MANPRNLANIAPNVNGSDGKVTIGTATTNGLLTLKNTNPATSLLSIQSYANTTEIGNIKYDQGTDLFSINTVNVAAGITFGTGASSTERARITSGGILLVGTTSVVDSATVEAYSSNNGFASRVVNNAFFLYSGLNASGTRTFLVLGTGNVQNTNNSYGAISDIKLKENIVDASPKLADLMQVKVRNYNLKSDPTQKQIGVVAQELETIFPSMIDESSDKDEEGNDLGTTTKAVKYSVFVPMLIKAIQEQQTMIESLKARLDAANL